MIVIKENVERIYEKLSKIASAKERKINKKQYLLTQLFEDFFSEREREKEQKLKSAKAFWWQQQQVQQQQLLLERKAEAKNES